MRRSGGGFRARRRRPPEEDEEQRQRRQHQRLRARAPLGGGGANVFSRLRVTRCRDRGVPRGSRTAQTARKNRAGPDGADASSPRRRIRGKSTHGVLQGTPGVLQGYSRALQGYSRGTPGVLKGYSRGTEGCLAEEHPPQLRRRVHPVRHEPGHRPPAQSTP